jgi:hypothetical protein
MIQALPWVRRLAAVALLAVPGLALAQDKPKEAPLRTREAIVEFAFDDSTPQASDAKLAELEAKLQALLKEIQALRGGGSSAKSPPVLLKSKTVAEPVRVHVDFDPVVRGKVVAAEEKKKSEAAAKGEKPRVVVIESATGEKKVFGLEDLKNLEKKELMLWMEKEGKAQAANAKKMAEDIKAKVEFLKKPTGDSPPAKEPVRVRATTQYRVTPQPAPAVAQFRVTSGSSDTIALSRSTYTLPAGKAAALASFLKEITQVKVLETNVEDDKLTVTTTPDVQSTIGQIVGLMIGKPVTATFQMKYDLVKPAATAKPEKP